MSINSPFGRVSRKELDGNAGVILGSEARPNSGSGSKVFNGPGDGGELSRCHLEMVGLLPEDGFKFE